MKINTVNDENKVDITDLYFEFKTKWRNVFIYRLGEYDFIYRALGRKEYKDIINDKRFNNFEKEDIICDKCLLYPKYFDWDNCDAGVPTELLKNILKNSYLDAIESQTSVLDYYRSEMYDLDNQITAIIAEAFNLDIEIIEQWDVEKTMKYLSRAEWTLHNLRGIPLKDAGVRQDNYDNEEIQYNKTQQKESKTKKQTNTPSKKNDSDATIRGGSRKNKLTPDLLRELKAKYPDINWENDDGLRGIKGLQQQEIDLDTPPALRPGFY